MNIVYENKKKFIMNNNCMIRGENYQLHISTNTDNIVIKCYAIDKTGQLTIFLQSLNLKND